MGKRDRCPQASLGPVLCPAVLSPGYQRHLRSQMLMKQDQQGFHSGNHNTRKVDTPQSTPRLTRGRLTSVQTAALYWVSSRSVHNLGVLSTE